MARGSGHVSDSSTMKSPRPFRGMMPILPTPVTERGAIDVVSLRRLVEYCVSNRAEAIGHFGIASEFFKLTDADRRLIAQTVVEVVDGRVPVFFGVTGASTRIAVEYAREAEALGASLLMVAIPYVNVPDREATFAYYEAVAGATRLPVIVQDTPLSDAILTPQFVARMFRDIENVSYVKAEGKEFLAKTAGIIEATEGRMPVIGGLGGKHMIHLLRLGVTSFMTGTEWLDLHAGIVEAFVGGDVETAERLYFEKLLPYFVFYEAYPEELLKVMLHMRGLIECPDILPPRATKAMGDAERAEFQWVLERVRFPADCRQLVSGGRSQR